MVENNSEIEVQILSSELVKPSTPTPSHLKTFTLSYVDQILPLVPPFLTTGLVFYSAPSESHTLDITRLKTSLSKTLCIFYPLAGRIKQSVIDCNDEGIPFIEAHVNCSLLAYLSSPRKLDLATKFLPPRDALGIRDEPVVELVHLAIQINVFTCGGVAIAWYDIHKVMDGSSSATFFKHWAGLTSQRYDDLIQPDFNATVTAFPPTSKVSKLDFENGYKEDNVQRISTTVKSFIFSNEAISELKARAASEVVPNPTRYLSLAGFIWEQVMAAKAAAIGLIGFEKHIDSILQVTLDLRPRINPPLPRGSIGNLVNTAVAHGDNQTAMPDLVVQIHDAVAKVKNEVRSYQGERAVEDVRANWNKLITLISQYNDRAYKLVSWSKLGFNDLEFGFGKPIWMVPTDMIMSPFHKNLMILTDYKDLNGDGIEAWFFLEQKEMEMLETNQDFLAFASPVY